MAHRPILITGSSGQLALALESAARARGLPAVRLGRPAFDFDRGDSIQAGFQDVNPSLVLNAAAYTAVDAAEDDAAAAARANHDGPTTTGRPRWARCARPPASRCCTSPPTMCSTG